MLELEGKKFGNCIQHQILLRFFRKVMEDEYIYVDFNTNVGPCIIKPEFETNYTVEVCRFVFKKL